MFRAPSSRLPDRPSRALVRHVTEAEGVTGGRLAEEAAVFAVQIIVGDRIGNFGSYHEGLRLFDKATCRKDLFVVRGASHYDLYDQPRPVGEAVERLTRFFRDTLAA